MKGIVAVEEEDKGGGPTYIRAPEPPGSRYLFALVPGTYDYPHSLPWMASALSHQAYGTNPPLHSAGHFQKCAHCPQNYRALLDGTQPG